MSTAWLAATDVVLGARARRPSGVVTVVTEPRLRDLPACAQTEHWLCSIGVSRRQQRWVTLDPPAVTTPTDLADAVGEPRSATVVVVGGGSLIDPVKLESCGRSGLVREVPSRSGLLVVPPTPARRVPLVAVPTTLGTGTEASSVAVAPHGGRRLLVMGRVMRPQAYAHVPDAWTTLPSHLVREGVAEIVSRLAGPFVGDAEGDPVADALVLTLLTVAVRAGEHVVADLEQGRPPSAPALLTLARAGALAHSEQVQRPHAPWAVRLWAVAHETAQTLGVSKMSATAGLWPAFWSAIDDGARVWGHRDRLALVWSTIRAASTAPLPNSPGRGVAELLHRLGVAPSWPDEVQAPVVAQRVLQSWAAGLPMLGAVGDPDLTRLLTAARPAHPTVDLLSTAS